MKGIIIVSKSLNKNMNKLEIFIEIVKWWLIQYNWKNEEWNFDQKLVTGLGQEDSYMTKWDQWIVGKDRVTNVTEL